mgnify:CR=1 FL=1
MIFGFIFTALAEISPVIETFFPAKFPLSTVSLNDAFKKLFVVLESLSNIPERAGPSRLIESSLLDVPDELPEVEELVELVEFDELVELVELVEGNFLLLLETIPALLGVSVCVLISVKLLPVIGNLKIPPPFVAA